MPAVGQNLIKNHYHRGYIVLLRTLAPVSWPVQQGASAECAEYKLHACFSKRITEDCGAMQSCSLTKICLPYLRCSILAACSRGCRLPPPLHHANLSHTTQNNHVFAWNAELDPGSGRKTPAMWHGAGAYPGVFIPET